MTVSSNVGSSSTPEKEADCSEAGLSIWAIVFLLVTAAISLLWSQFLLLMPDEFLVMWTDRAGSLKQLIAIQRNSPISLDPMLYHAITYFCIHLFGATAFAIRLPSLFGFLLMQVCLYLFVRRMASEQAAVFALVFPVLTGAFGYSMTGRPYGLLLGFFGLAMVSWQAAIREETRGVRHYAGLALSIALALNTHYYGVLLFLPLVGAELFRVYRRRRMDYPVLAAVVIGAAGIVFTLPFLKAAREFRGHYYSNLDKLKPMVIAKAYGMILSNHPFIHRAAGAANFFLIGIVLLAMCAAFFAYLRRTPGERFGSMEAETVFLAVLASLPFFGFLLARFSTNTLEPRFVLGAVIGLAAISAIGLFSLLNGRRIEVLTPSMLLVVVLATGVSHIAVARKTKSEDMASMGLTSNVQAMLESTPSRKLYFENEYALGLADSYLQEPELRSHLVLMYSRSEELRWANSDTRTLTALHMRAFTPYTIVPYEQVAAEPGEHLLVDFDGKGYWLERSLVMNHAFVKPVGSAFGESSVSLVRFH